MTGSEFKKMEFEKFGKIVKLGFRYFILAAVVWLALNLFDRQIKEFLIAYIIPLQAKNESVHWTVYFAAIVLIAGISLRITITGYYNRGYDHWLFKLYAAVFISYIYYRFYVANWVFLPVESNIFKYIDLAWFPFVTYMMGFLLSKEKSKRALQSLKEKIFSSGSKKKSNKNETDKEVNHFFLEDNVASSDDFGRSKLAENLAPQLLDQHFKSAFCIGVLGEWGSGKSSFLEFLVKELLKKQSSNLEIIKYQPWLNHQGETIITDYFQILKERLGKYDLSLDLKLESYENALLGFESPVLSFLTTVRGTNDSAEKAYHNLKNAIKRIDKKVIVIIDDLDRLDRTELMEILRLVRNTADFPNFIYLLALDRKYVIQQIGQINQKESLTYLDKFFQFEINLPSLSTERLFAYFDQVVSDSKFIQEKYHKGINLSQSLSSFFPGAIDSPRDVKRLINAIKFELVDDRFELDFPELVLVQILRVKFFPIYEALALKKDTYFTDFEGYLSLELIKIEADFENEFKSLPERSREQLKSILWQLFSRDSTSDPTRGARNPELFDIYFNYRALSGELPEKLYREFINNPKEVDTDFELYLEKYEQLILDQIMREPCDQFPQVVKVQDALFGIGHHKTKLSEKQDYSALSKSLFELLLNLSINPDLSSFDGYLVKFKQYIKEGGFPEIPAELKIQYLKLSLNWDGLAINVQKRLFKDLYNDLLSSIDDIKERRQPLFEILMNSVRNDSFRDMHLHEVYNYFLNNKGLLQHTLEQILTKNGNPNKYYGINENLLQDFFGLKPDKLLREDFGEHDFVKEFLSARNIINISGVPQVLFDLKFLHIHDERRLPKDRMIIFELGAIPIFEKSLLEIGTEKRGSFTQNGFFCIVKFPNHIETTLSSIIEDALHDANTNYRLQVKNSGNSKPKLFDISSVEFHSINKTNDHLMSLIYETTGKSMELLKVIYFSPNFKPSELS